MMRSVFSPLERSTLERSRRFVRWTVLLCAAVALVVVLAAVYVSLFTAVLLAVAGVIGLAFWSVTQMPAQPPRSVEAQVQLLEQAWDQEVPASQRAMVEAYLDDPELAVAALVGSRTSVSPEAARQFLASRVTG
jgi:hypothetical protein